MVPAALSLPLSGDTHTSTLVGGAAAATLALLQLLAARVITAVIIVTGALNRIADTALRPPRPALQRWLLAPRSSLARGATARAFAFPRCSSYRSYAALRSVARGTAARCCLRAGRLLLRSDAAARRGAAAAPAAPYVLICCQSCY